MTTGNLKDSVAEMLTELCDEIKAEDVVARVIQAATKAKIIESRHAKELAARNGIVWPYFD